MRRYRLVFFFGLSATIFLSCQQPRSPRKQVYAYLTNEVDSMKRSTSLLLSALEKGHVDEAQVLFDQARRHYKHVEAIVEFYFPSVAKALNGPALRKVDEHDDKILEPTGFQVVEELLFAEDVVRRGEHENIISVAKTLDNSVTRLIQVTKSTEFSDDNIFEAMRLHLLRIMSLGLSGFDSPVHLNSVAEAQYSLEGIAHLVDCYASKRSENSPFYPRIKTLLSLGGDHLGKRPSFDDFDRAGFIIEVIDPLAGSISDYQLELGIPNRVQTTALRQDARTFFSPDTFDPSFFSPAYAQHASAEIVSLGKLLFFDPILSGNNARSCASCHNPLRAFSDGTRTSQAFNNKGTIGRNAPTLINSAFQQSFFWDARVTFMEDQITEVVSNPIEMHGNLSGTVPLFETSPEYQELFKSAFPNAMNNRISEKNIRIALAGYVRSLQAMNSRFDQYMRGDTSALKSEEIAGFNLFMGKAKCGTCHFTPLFNGTVPPTFRETESEVIGVPSNAVLTHASLDSDPGKFGLFPHHLFNGMFKTPTIRNAELTAPYMHNGVYASLEEVIDFYNRGGGAGIGIELGNQTLPPDELNLSASEQENIISFIRSLTDTTGLMSMPRRLPQLQDPKLNARNVGGVY